MSRRAKAAKVAQRQWVTEDCRTFSELTANPLPDLLALCDVAGQVLSGAAFPEDDWLGLRPAMPAADPRAAACWRDPEAVAAVASHLQRFALDRHAALRRLEMAATGLREGMFDSSWLFNLGRLLERHAEFGRFDAYYRAIDASHWIGACRERWSPETLRLVSALWRGGRLDALSLRGVGNIIEYVSAAGVSLDDEDAVGAVLPNVARWALGEVEYRPQGVRGRSSMQRPGVASAQGPAHYSLPMLAEIREVEVRGASVDDEVASRLELLASDLLARLRGEQDSGALAELARRHGDQAERAVVAAALQRVLGAG